MIKAAATLPNVTIHDLYETYPDFHIDIAAEQAQLAAADLVVFQHPIQWYSMPALLKEWVDTVLEDGWAFGKGGTALRDKSYWLVVTTGSPVDAYATTGMHHLPFDAFLPQFQQTASLCGMRWQTPLVIHNAHQLSQQDVAAHARHYVELLSRWPGSLAADFSQTT